MTENLANRVKEQIRLEEQGITVLNNKKQRIDVDKFRIILKLELAEPSKEAVLEAINILEKRDDVRSAEPNYIGKFSTLISNDLYRNDQWALNYLQLPDAWHISTGNATVRVGIADSGIDRNHPDLVGRINEELSRDHTGGGNPWTTNVVHGTHVAGIVGAIGNNSVGVTGSNWNVELVSLKVGNEVPTAAAVAEAILYAGDNDIRVLNLSLTINETTAINDAINAFNGVIICGAGNEKSNIVGYPARLNNERIISVGSLDNDGSRSSFSNWGKVDIWAPGGNILSTIPTGTTPNGYRRHSDGYAYTDGTSMAAPYVSGIAALMLAVNPDLTINLLHNNIVDTGNIINITHPSGFLGLGSTTISVSRLNAYNAVSAIATYDTMVLSDNTIKICGTFDKLLSGSINIPETLNGRTVTRIAKSAFANQTQMSQISIPASVTSIETLAFGRCSELVSVIFANESQLTSIGNAAFQDCSNLSSIIIPSGVTSIDTYTFLRCISLTSIQFAENSSLTEIGFGAFQDCSNLSSIIIPSGVTSIDTSFIRCTSLKSITIPKSVTSIGDNAFYGCANLTNIIREYNVNASSSSYYDLTIDNIGNAIVKIDGVLTSLINNTKRIYLKGGNHTIRVEATSITQILSTPTIIAAMAAPTVSYISQSGDQFSVRVTNNDSITSTIYLDHKELLNGQWVLIGSDSFILNSGSSIIYTANFNNDLNTHRIIVRAEGANKRPSFTSYVNVNVVNYAVVTFDPTGGTVYPSTKNVYYNTKYGDLPIPIRSNYIFDGWYTSNGMQITSITPLISQDNHTLYARWKLQDVIIYSAQGSTYEEVYLNSSNIVVPYYFVDVFAMGYDAIVVLALAAEEGHYSYLSATFTEFGLIYEEYNGMTLEWACYYMEGIEIGVSVTPNYFAMTPHIIEIRAICY